MKHIIFGIFSIIFISKRYECQKVEISWEDTLRLSKTTPTLQLVVNPQYERKSKIHDRVFTELKNLGAEYVRYAVWFPYPKLAIAELDPPTTNSTSWNFTLIDPMMIDFMNAQKGKKVILSFSTIPAWMFKTDKPVPYPSDPDQVDWNYNQGTELVDSSLNQLADYYARLYSWYTKGGFIDELGQKHESGHHYNIDYWEIFNEVEYEHNTTPQQYTGRYDAIAGAIQKISPNTKFVGMALESPGNDLKNWFPYFLNHSNHKQGVPLDMISYHFYALTDEKDPIDKIADSYFSQADNFFKTVNSIESIRMMYSPDTQTTIDEIGTINEKVEIIPKSYWNLSGALFAYIFSHLSIIGIEIAGESQLVGFPTQYPSVSMVDWETGAPNARFQVLKLLIDNFGPGDKLVKTTFTANVHIYAMGFHTKSDQKKLLLINQRSERIEVQLSEVANETHFIDVDTVDKIETKELRSDKLTLGGFAVHIITF